MRRGVDFVFRAQYFVCLLKGPGPEAEVFWAASPSGKAGACKALIPGSIPGAASNVTNGPDCG